MTELELLAQFLRYHRKRVRGFFTGDTGDQEKDTAECKTLANDWIGRFANIDVEVCRAEVSDDILAKWPGDIHAVHARCRVAQDEKNAAKPRPRPEAWTPEEHAAHRVGIRACLLMSRNRGMTYEDALSQAREEVGDE